MAREEKGKIIFQPNIGRLQYSGKAPDGTTYVDATPTKTKNDGWLAISASKIPAHLDCAKPDRDFRVIVSEINEGGCTEQSTAADQALVFFYRQPGISFRPREDHILSAPTSVAVALVENGKIVDVRGVVRKGVRTPDNTQLKFIKRLFDSGQERVKESDLYKK